MYTFECNPATIPLCRAKVAGREHITLTEKAVSDKDGTVTFFPIDQEKTNTPWADGNPGASSLLRSSGKYTKEKNVQKEITVPSTTLSSFMREKSLGEIDLLWMDIQGAKSMALQSAGSMLANIKNNHLEVEYMEIYSGQPLMADIKNYLNRNGFSLYAFTNFGRYSGDAVFVNNSLNGGHPIPGTNPVSMVPIRMDICFFYQASVRPDVLGRGTNKILFTSAYNLHEYAAAAFTSLGSSAGSSGL